MFRKAKVQGKCRWVQNSGHEEGHVRVCQQKKEKKKRNENQRLC
uniref:Uncharacterized protein n=1 Tax=Anguilla anguilla TaxID=7936 RepID=A0A0E9RBR6_ANGAN